MTAPRFHLNGVEQVLVGPPDRPLLEILREDHGLMAAKPGCGIGRCGACMVLIDGRPANSCLVRGHRLDGTEIITAEGLDALPQTRTVREALIAENAFQCGYCAPGITVSLVALKRRNPKPDEAAVREALAGNLCRCTGYASILRAVASI